METKFTPGPWEVRAGRGGGPNGATIVAGSQLIARLSAKADCPIDMKEANAYLMAQAPDLLDSLREAVDVIGDADWTGKERAIAIISKATGGA